MYFIPIKFVPINLCYILFNKIDLLQYPFYIYSFLPFKTILLLVSLHSPLYKSLSLLSSPVSKKPMIEIKEVDDVDSDIEMQPLSSQQPLKSALQTL